MHRGERFHAADVFKSERFSDHRVKTQVSWWENDAGNAGGRSAPKLSPSDSQRTLEISNLREIANTVHLHLGAAQAHYEVMPNAKVGFSVKMEDGRSIADIISGCCFGTANERNTTMIGTCIVA